MTVSLLLGLACGMGLWIVAAALKPRPVPLARAIADLHRPPGPDTVPVSGRALDLVTSLGAWTPRREQQLALAGISPQAWARDKLLGAAAGLTVPLAVWAALTTLGIGLPPTAGLAALACTAAGFFLPDLRLREQVAQRRKAFQYALSAYLDLVNVILAGGGGIETALVAAADAGEGWAFGKLRHALHRAQRINQPLWTAFDDLGAELGVAELRDLASAIGLAGAQGARIRASLAVKADTLRSRQIAETEAAAEATTERMNLPTAVLLLGFLIFIVFPAVTAITGVNHTGCIPGTPDCHTPTAKP
ncbi:type II secretion system F family protein [Egicoccus sp. AB-alg6-2]|uniref:type II secretion system F family protein n=1 Tax=Egicoccus sp. AB-alg6-2 TaxID=3242692 RepID=UPI00359D9D8B